jgi:hypothetical protein
LGSDDDSFFDIDLLEVWAVRVDNNSFRRGVQAGELCASVKEAARQRLAKVNREDFLDDFASGSYLNSLFQHRTQSRGRADFVASDDEGAGYFVESKPPSFEKTQLAKRDITAVGDRKKSNITNMQL